MHKKLEMSIVGREELGCQMSPADLHFMYGLHMCVLKILERCNLDMKQAFTSNSYVYNPFPAIILKRQEISRCKQGKIACMVPPNQIHY